MIAFLRFGWALVLAIPDIVGLVKWILRLAAQYQLASERRAFLKEMKEGVKENVQNLDNSRLDNLLNPSTTPFARTPTNPGVFDEKTEPLP